MQFYQFKYMSIGCWNNLAIRVRQMHGNLCPASHTFAGHLRIFIFLISISSVYSSFEPLDIHPFTMKNFHEAGHERWKHMKKILIPITKRNLAMASRELQMIVDKTRNLFNTLLHHDGLGANECCSWVMGPGGK